MNALTIQYLLSNGDWRDCGDRTEKFLARCEEFNGVNEDGAIVSRFRAVRKLTRDEVVAALLAGRELHNEEEDWHGKCRALVVTTA